MISSLETRYREDCIALADSTVMYHSIAAQGINNYLSLRDMEVGTSPATWKYHLNLMGEYHSSDYLAISVINKGNQYMQVWAPVNGVPTSMNLTKDLLADTVYGPIIRSQYRFGSPAFELLRDTYPEHHELIMGIFYPVSWDVLEQAEDGDVLVCGGYIKTLSNQGVVYTTSQGLERARVLLHPNELSLIQDIEQWFKDMLFRWVINAYAGFNNLYVQTVHAMLYSLLPARIVSLRLTRCGTSEVHPYYLRAKLDSVAGLGDVVDVFSLKTSLYLYRNIHALNARKGNRVVLDELLEYVAVPEAFPLAGYEFKQFPDTYDTDGRVVKRLQRMTLGNASVGEAPAFIDLIKLLTDNGDDFQLAPNAKDIDERAQRYNSNNAVTKHLVCYAEYSPGFSPFTIETVAIPMWIYSVMNGHLNGSVTIPHPHTGAELSLSPKQAFALAYYSFCVLYYGKAPNTVPTFIIDYLPKSLALSIGGSNGLESTATLKDKFPLVDTETSIAMQTGFKPTYSYPDLSQFSEECHQAYSQIDAHFRLVPQTDRALVRASRLAMLVNNYWMNVSASFPNQADLEYSALDQLFNLSLEALPTNTLTDWLYGMIDASMGGLNQAKQVWLNRHQQFVAVLKAFLSYTTRLSTRFTDQNAVHTDQPLGRSYSKLEDISYALLVTPGWSTSYVTMQHDNGFVVRPTQANTKIQEPVQSFMLYNGIGTQTYTLINQPNTLTNPSGLVRTTITVETN